MKHPTNIQQPLKQEHLVGISNDTTDDLKKTKREENARTKSEKAVNKMMVKNKYS